MSSTTTRLGLYKPASGENVNVATDLNNNWDSLDLNSNFRSCTSTTRPSVVWAGLGIWETDTNQTHVSNGSAPASGSWIQIPNGANQGVINLTGAATGTDTLTVLVTGDTQKRLILNADGRFEWGSGSGAVDTNLYRSAADTLKTDDALSVGGALTVTGAATINGAVTATGAASLGALTVPSFSINGQGYPVVTYKTADTDRANTVTATSDNHLTTSLLASSTYLVEFNLLFGGLNAADLKTVWTVPSGATGNKTCVGPTVGGTTTTDAEAIAGRWGTHGFTTATNYGCIRNSISLYQGAYESAIVTTSSAGTIALQWAQTTTNATATRLAGGSWMRVTKVA